MTKRPKHDFWSFWINIISSSQDKKIWGWVFSVDKYRGGAKKPKNEVGLVRISSLAATPGVPSSYGGDGVG